MSEQKRRAPGRPKKTQETFVAEAPAQEAPAQAAPTKKTLEFKQPKINQPQNAVFRIIRGGGIAYMLPQSAMTVYDEEKNTVRSIRYCPNEPSIYVDEQSDNARKEAVIFYDKMLAVPKTKPNLLAFLEAHPNNVANGGTVFEKVDNKKKSQNDIAKEFAVADAVRMVRDKSMNELLPVAIYNSLNINRDFSEVRYDLLRIAKKDPAGFIQSFDKPEVRTRAIATQANDYQIIKVNNSGAYWFDSNSLIVSNPVGMESMDTFVRFLLTEKGSSVLSRLEDELSSL